MLTRLCRRFSEIEIYCGVAYSAALLSSAPDGDNHPHTYPPNACVNCAMMSIMSLGRQGIIFLLLVHGGANTPMIRSIFTAETQTVGPGPYGSSLSVIPAPREQACSTVMKSLCALRVSAVKHPSVYSRLLALLDEAFQRRRIIAAHPGCFTAWQSK